MSDLAKLVINRFPENRNMQLVGLRIPGRFDCFRCKKPQHARLLAVVSDNWDRLLCVACYERTLSEPRVEPLENILAKEWLGNSISVRHAEEDNMVDDIPFGSQFAEWEVFKAAMIEGDEIWEFTGPPESGERLAGKIGYALVRQEKIVKCLVIQMN